MGPNAVTGYAPVFNATVNGVYTVTAKSGTTSNTQTIAVNSHTIVPTITVSPTSSELTCASPSVILVAQASIVNPLIQWLGPGIPTPTITPTQYIAAIAGVYTVLAVDSTNGCQSETTALVIENREYPVLQLVSIYTMTCEGEVTLSLPTHTAISYQVEGDASATFTLSNSVLSILSPGEYSITATNTVNGCSTKQTFDVWSCTALNESNDTRISILPNPSTGLIQFSSPVEGLITISTVDGKNWMAITDDQNRLDLSDLPEGVYFITFQYHHQKLRKRLVLVR